MAFAWNTDVRKAIIKCYYRSEQRIGGGFMYDAAQYRQELTEQYPELQNVNPQVINKQIRRVLKLLQDTGSVAVKKRRCAPRTLNEAKIAEIRQTVEDSQGKVSIRKLSARVNISRGSVHTALRKQLNFRAYKITRFHKMEPADVMQRVAFCEWSSNNMGDEILDISFFSDEAWIHLDGYVNSQNCRIWGSENPREFVSTVRSFLYQRYFIDIMFMVFIFRSRNLYIL